MNPRGFAPRRPRIRENVNEAIRAREVRAVFPDGSVEVMPTMAAVRRAQELGLDLILIAPTAEPPVAKAMDYGQWQYENKKKQHEAKRKQHIIQVKELKFRPNTDDHDYDFKKNHAIRFLQEGNRVKAIVQFRGREIAHTDLGRKLLIRFAADLTQYGAVEGQPRLEGRNAHVMISPVKVIPPAKEKPEKPKAPVTPAARRLCAGLTLSSASCRGRRDDPDPGCDRDACHYAPGHSGSADCDHNGNCDRSSHCSRSLSPSELQLEVPRQSSVSYHPPN